MPFHTQFIEDPTISGIASIEATEAVAYIKKFYNKKFKVF